jgi:hypothetical protein
MWRLLWAITTLKNEYVGSQRRTRHGLDKLGLGFITSVKMSNKDNDVCGEVTHLYIMYQSAFHSLFQEGLLSQKEIKGHHEVLYSPAKDDGHSF